MTNATVRINPNFKSTPADYKDEIRLEIYEKQNNLHRYSLCIKKMKVADQLKWAEYVANNYPVDNEVVRSTLNEICAIMKNARKGYVWVIDDHMVGQSHESGIPFNSRYHGSKQAAIKLVKDTIVI
jgi:hypothetical protein